jgi:hypothetical protein
MTIRGLPYAREEQSRPVDRRVMRRECHRLLFAGSLDEDAVLELHADSMSRTPSRLTGEVVESEQYVYLG